MAIPKKVYQALEIIQEYCNKYSECDDCPISSFCLVEFPSEWNLKLLKNKEQKDLKKKGMNSNEY